MYACVLSIPIGMVGVGGVCVFGSFGSSVDIVLAQFLGDFRLNITLS